MTELTSEKILDMLSVAIDRNVITANQIISQVKPRAKGRKVTDLPSFTFKGSGIEVKIRTLGPFTLDAISRSVREEIQPPDVPRVMVNYGTSDKPDFKMEENPADPEYKKVLEEYERKIGEEGGRKTIDTIINHAVVAEIDEEEVQAMRLFLLDLGVSKEELDRQTDHAIYIKHVCIKTANDLTDLQNFVIGQSVPTEERVKAHEDSFRGEVQGETNQEMHRSTVGNNSQHHA